MPRFSVLTYTTYAVYDGLKGYQPIKDLLVQNTANQIAAALNALEDEHNPPIVEATADKPLHPDDDIPF